jgi:hypothetical protein
MIHTTKEDEMSTATAKTPAKKATKTTPGALIDSMWELRDKKRKLEASIKDLDGQLDALESELMERMAADGLDKMTGKCASVSISTSVVANVEDWDAFMAWIYKTKNGHLLQRRVSDPAWREMVELKGVVPGTQPFTKKRLNLRALS